MFGQKSTLEQAREEHHPITMDIDSSVLGNQYKPEITSLMEAELHYRRHDVVKRKGISEYINEDDVMHLCGYTNITNPSKWRKEIIARHNFVSGVDFMTKDEHSHQKRGQKPKIVEFSLRAANRILLAAMTPENGGITPILTSDQKLTMCSSQFAEILGYEKKFINQKIRELFPEEIASKKILLVTSRYGGVDEYHLPEVESNMLVAKWDVQHLRTVSEYFVQGNRESPSQTPYFDDDLDRIEYELQQRQLFLVDKARKQEQRIGRVEDVLVNKFAPAINQKANRNEVITQEEADGRYVRQSSEIPEGYKSVNAICEQYFLTYSDNGKKKSKTKFAPQITSAIKNMFTNMSIPSIKHTNWYGNESCYYHESNYQTIMEALIDGMEYDRTTKSGNKIYVNSEAGIEVTLYPDVDGNVALKPQSTASSLDEFFE